MSALFPAPPGPASDSAAGEREGPGGHVARPRGLEAHRLRWEVRGARFRAHALAEAVFGPDAHVLPAGGEGGMPPFRGLVRVVVPFADIDVHRWRERIFVSCAARDPLLAGVPLVYLFEPLTTETA